MSAQENESAPDPIHKLAAQIVRHLPGWRVDAMTPPDWRHGVEIFNTADRRERLSLSLNDWHHKGRLSVYGIKAAYKKRGQITVDPKRPPAQIAAEIVRRSLPEYREGLADLRETEARMQAAADAKEAQRGCLLAVCPSIEEARDFNRSGLMYTFKGRPGVSGVIRDNGYDGKFTVELSIRFDEVVKVLAFLNAT